MLSNLVVIKQSFYAMIIPTNEVFSIRLGFLKHLITSENCWNGNIVCMTVWVCENQLISGKYCVVRGGETALWSEQNYFFFKNMVVSHFQTDSTCNSIIWAKFSKKYIRESPMKRLLGGVFELEMVKIVLTSHFHKKLRAIIGLVPTSQLSWCCYIENSEWFGKEMA